jgi:hypothetical protein
VSAVGPGSVGRPESVAGRGPEDGPPSVAGPGELPSLRYPAANRSVAPGSAAASASSGTSTWVGLTWELPAPWNRGVRANSPITATVRPAMPVSGSTPSFLSSTRLCAAARRARA